MALEFKPKFEKIVELLLYLALKRPNADKYQAVKFFYLADKLHLTKYGRPITHEIYYALPMGPIASNAMDLLEGDKLAFKKAGIDSLPFETETVKRWIGPDLLYIRKPLRDVDFDLFSKSDIEVFDEIIDRFGNFTFKQLYNVTHDHFAYKRAWKEKAAGSKRALMRYDEMIDDEQRRKQIVEDISPVAAHME